MSFITDMFGAKSPPPMPAPMAPPPPPTLADADLKAQQDGDALRKRQGRAATILSGQQGASAPNVGTKALLGS